MLIQSWNLRPGLSGALFIFSSLAKDWEKIKKRERGTDKGVQIIINVEKLNLEI